MFRIQILRLGHLLEWHCNVSVSFSRGETDLNIHGTRIWEFNICNGIYLPRICDHLTSGIAFLWKKHKLQLLLKIKMCTIEDFFWLLTFCYLQPWCKIFKTSVKKKLYMQYFVLDYLFSSIFAFFLCKSFTKARTKIISKLFLCNYSVFLGYVIEIVCFIIYL